MATKRAYPDIHLAIEALVAATAAFVMRAAQHERLCPCELCFGYLDVARHGRQGCREKQPWTSMLYRRLGRRLQRRTGLAESLAL